MRGYKPNMALGALQARAWRCTQNAFECSGRYMTRGVVPLALLALIVLSRTKHTNIFFERGTGSMTP